MDAINKLTELFSEFPGIGPRQAKRFVYYLLRRDKYFLENISKNILDLKESITSCEVCHRFFQKKNASQKICSICSDKNRDASLLLLVSFDVDLEHIEKSGTYNGLYFVLGGIVPILSQNPDERVRGSELTTLVSKRANDKILREIILGMNATTEGDNTGEYISRILTPIISEHSIKISHLGRGISTGTEIEYSDKDTLKNALENRK